MTQEFLIDVLKSLPGDPRPKRAHIFAKSAELFYIEPQWCSTRLFAVERFPGPVWDPFCGTGRVAEAARVAGYETYASDIVDRGYRHLNRIEGFLTVDRLDPNMSLVANPPFDDQILKHAISLDPTKMALIWPLARVVAVHAWLSKAPLARVLMMTPRPPMPPGSYIARREEAARRPRRARVARVRARLSRTGASRLASSRPRHRRSSRKPTRQQMRKKHG
jgi:hypothetical protein